MAARYYERNTSGMNFDRFLDNFDESKIVTMKRHYWTARQLLRSKIGKKEDEHLLASDADLDSKLTLFRSVRDTSENLLAAIENYQAYLYDATLCENELGRYLKDQGKKEKRSETATVMTAVGRALLFASHQRAAIRPPLVRFYQELHVFAERAIADCCQTVDAVERARIEYRGSLLWIKKTSEELDPDTDRQLEKFREAQTAVRTNKERLDKLKLDTLQKVDLLSASRSNLLSHILGKYLECLSDFYDKTSKTYSTLADNLSVFQHYEFEILTELIEPSKRVEKKVRQDSLEKQRIEKERKKSEREEKDGEKLDDVGTLVNVDEEPENSMKRLLFGRESPVGEEKVDDEDERVDSPLGLLDETAEDALNVTSKQMKRFDFGPLPAKKIQSSLVPRLQPPPNSSTPGTSSSCSGPALLELESEDEISGKKLEDLFPLMSSRSNKLQQKYDNSLVDLLNLGTVPSTSSSSFPNPFEQSKNPEWDLLISQCDMQQSTTDLL